MTVVPATDEEIADVRHRFARGHVEFETTNGSPLYAHLCPHIAADDELVALAAERRIGQHCTVLFFGAVHDLLLAGARHELREWYADLVEHPRPPASAFPAFRDFCLSHRDALAETLARRLVQTNVPKRSIALRLGLQQLRARGAVGDSVHLIDVGTSAGLNLAFDRYGCDVGGRRFGPADAGLVLTAEWRGEAPVPDLDAIPAVTSRVGLDLNPIDLDDPTERRWLQALVWPENTEKRRILETAIEVAGSDRPPLWQGDVNELLPGLVDRAPADASLVVFHSVMAAHLPPPTLGAMRDFLEHLGGRRAYTWLCLERHHELTDRLGLGFAMALSARSYDGAAGVVEVDMAVCDHHVEWIVPVDLV